jgi:hypothetical protein
MTQDAINSLHASEPSSKFNVTLVESLQNLPGSTEARGTSASVDIQRQAAMRAFTSRRHKTDVGSDGFFWVNGVRLRGPEGSNGQTIAIEEGFDEYICNFRGQSYIVHPKPFTPTGVQDTRIMPKYAGCKVIYPVEPFGYNKYMMLGSKHGSSETIMFVNNDVTFKPGWWRVIKAAMEDHKLDSASPRCPRWAMHRDLADQFKGASVILGCRTSHTLAGWAIITKRSTLASIGGLDTTAPFYASDNSYACQIKNAKLRHGLVMNSVVTHELGSTSRECRERGALYEPADTWLDQHYPGWQEWPEEMAI